MQKHTISVTQTAADLSKPEDVERVPHRLEGGTSITLLVNNARVSVVGSFAEAQPVVIAETLQVNVLAVTRLALAALSGFKHRDRGTVINMGPIRVPVMKFGSG